MTLSDLLPIKDNALFIDNSTFEEYTTCPRRYEYYGLRRREAVEGRTALTFGTIIHEALAAHYDGRDPLPVIAKAFTEWQPPFDDHRNEQFAMRRIKEYQERYPEEQFTIVPFDDKSGIELPFAVPLFHYHHPHLNDDKPFIVVWTGRIDLVTRWEDGLWVMDHKTSSMTGDSYWRAFENNNAQRGYCWAVSQVLQQPLRGFVINVISSRKPAVRSIGKDPFERQRFHVTEDSLDEWKTNTIRSLSSLFDEVANNYLPMRTAWCSQYGGCEYLPICTVARDQRETVLASGLYQPVTWSPLHPTKSEHEPVSKPQA